MSKFRLVVLNRRYISQCQMAAFCPKVLELPINTDHSRLDRHCCSSSKIVLKYSVEIVVTWLILNMIATVQCSGMIVIDW